MREVAVRAIALGKKYHRGVNNTGALIDRVRGRRRSEPFWALRNVSFNVRSGELVGIIGTNGSGKTTLLKILSRITRPNEGTAEIDGRVGSLLTVGTGFHRELTGRENIFLNGALLGMGKDEVRRQFDEIVDFSGVEDALDTPIKRYSSGMLVRLGFAIAAHLEQEIMLVDEVLAVGDVAFQRKCLAKINDVARHGRTVFLVSHEMPAITEVCDRALWLDGGCIRDFGQAPAIVGRYLEWMSEQDGPRQSFIGMENRTDRVGDERLRLRYIRLLDKDLNAIPCFTTDRGAKFALGYESCDPGSLSHLTISLKILNCRRLPVAVCESADTGPLTRALPSTGEFVCEFDRIALMPGQYSLDVSCRLGHTIVAQIIGAGNFTVIEGVPCPDRPLPKYERGDVLLDYRWRFGFPSTERDEENQNPS